jgi:hypothetical protein
MRISLRASLSNLGPELTGGDFLAAVVHIRHILC